jgi:phage/plasmid-associated DNA primase
MPPMAETVTTRAGTFEIRSEAHGPHWVAWLSRTADGGPELSVLLVGQTQAEAETRARKWAERQ